MRLGVQLQLFQIRIHDLLAAIHALRAHPHHFVISQGGLIHLPASSFLRE
jgi:hypothetical protein